MVSDIIPDKTPHEAVVPSGRERFIVKFPADGGGSEPLVTSGVTGAADFVYVTYLDGKRMQFGFDHWGVGGKGGAPVEVDPSRLHRLEIETGSLGPASTAISPPEPVRVLLDGANVLDGVSQIHPHGEGQVFIGKNPLGGSSCGPQFQGEILFSGPEG